MGMVNIHVWNSENNLWLFEGRIPTFETLRAAFPRSPPFYKNMEFGFASRDEAVSWMLSAFARRLLWYWSRRQYDPPLVKEQHQVLEDPDKAANYPIETWLIGFPKRRNAHFDRWFEEQPLDYRVMIHRNLCFTHDPQSENLWDHVYWQNRKRLPPMRWRRNYGDLRRTTQPILEEVLEAYGRGTQREYMDQIGHEYWFSEGLPG